MAEEEDGEESKEVGSNVMFGGLEVFRVEDGFEGSRRTPVTD